MKNYRLSEALGNIDEAFLEEVFEYETAANERRRITMSKKKLASIMIAAAAVVAIGVTTVAASWSRLNQLGDYFEDQKEVLNVPEGVPVITQPDVYATEVTESNDDAPFEAGTARITGFSCTDYNFYAIIEFNAEGFEIPYELPEDIMHDETYRFEWVGIAPSLGGTGGLDLISRDGDIFTYVFSLNGFMSMPEEGLTLELHKFGYFNADKEFVALHDIDVKVSISTDSVNVIEALNSMNCAEINGGEFEAELTPFGIHIFADSDKLVSQGFGKDEYELNNTIFACFRDVSIEFHMNNGTVFSDSFGTNENHELLITSSAIGVSYNDGISGAYFGFAVPIDYLQIDYVIVNGARFDFASAE